MNPDRLSVAYYYPNIPPVLGEPTARGWFLVLDTRGRERVVSGPFATEKLADVALRRAGGRT